MKNIKDSSQIFDKDPALGKEDFRKTFQWRIFRIMAEFVEGFQFVADLKNPVAIFGSSRFDEQNPDYVKARTLGNLLAKENFSVVTGGGPGIMEAANRGAAESGGKGESIGINIQLEEGERANEYMERSISFYYFFTRKVMLSFSSSGYVFFPGGFGTLDEFFEIMTLIQTKKIPGVSTVVVVGKSYWEPLLSWAQEELCQKYETIDQKDLEMINIVDTPEEALDVIKKAFDYKNNN